MRSFGGAAMNRVYETKDGKFLVLGGSEIHFAKNLLEALGRPDLLDLARLEPGPGQDPLKAFFKEAFATRTLAEWEAFLLPIDVCWAPVRSLKDALEDPYAMERGQVLQDAQGHRHLGDPIRFRNENGRENLMIPAYGEHSDTIASEAGLSPDQIAALKALGAL
jgi:crotonobetainyl-CoA:carnitine CoA-transferase CaiB-like acyl-CoA transferase